MSPEERERAEMAIHLIIEEFGFATSISGPFHSAHEGLGVIYEEFDELKDEVWKKAKDREADLMIQEAKQLGAMAMRFIVDVGLPLKAAEEELRKQQEGGG